MPTTKTLKRAASALGRAIYSCPTTVPLHSSLQTLHTPLLLYSSITALPEADCQDALASIISFAEEVTNHLNGNLLQQPGGCDVLFQLHTRALSLQTHLDQTGFYSAFHPSHSLAASLNDLSACLHPSGLAGFNSKSLLPVFTSLPILLKCLENLFNRPVASADVTNAVNDAIAYGAISKRHILPGTVASSELLLRQYLLLRDAHDDYKSSMSSMGLSLTVERRLLRFVQTIWDHRVISPSQLRLCMQPRPFNLHDSLGSSPISDTYKGLLEVSHGSKQSWTVQVAVRSFDVTSHAEKKGAFWFQALRLRTFNHECIPLYYGAHWPTHSPASSNTALSAVVVTERMTVNLRSARDGTALRSRDARLRVLRDVAQALDFLHTQGILHTGITPENVLLRVHKGATCGRAKLDVTGILGRTLSRESRYDRLLYRAPEVLREGEKQFLSSDVWSFGILTCFLLASSAGKNDDHETFFRALGNREGVGGIARDWAKTIEDERTRNLTSKCLIEDPKRRVTSTELVDGIAALLKEKFVNQDRSLPDVDDFQTNGLTANGGFDLHSSADLSSAFVPSSNKKSGRIRDQRGNICMDEADDAEFNFSAIRPGDTADADSIGALGIHTRKRYSESLSGPSPKRLRVGPDSRDVSVEGHTLALQKSIEARSSSDKDSWKRVGSVIEASVPKQYRVKRESEAVVEGDNHRRNNNVSAVKIEPLQEQRVSDPGLARRKSGRHEHMVPRDRTTGLPIPAGDLRFRRASSPEIQELPRNGRRSSRKRGRNSTERRRSSRRGPQKRIAESSSEREELSNTNDPQTPRGNRNSQVWRGRMRKRTPRVIPKNYENRSPSPAKELSFLSDGSSLQLQDEPPLFDSDAAIQIPIQNPIANTARKLFRSSPKAEDTIPRAPGDISGDVKKENGTLRRIAGKPKPQKRGPSASPDSLHGNIDGGASKLSLLSDSDMKMNARQQYKAGKCFQEGIRVEQDLAKAVQYFEVAARGGDLDATYCLGQMYADGKGVTPSIFKAFKLYHLANSAGHLPSKVKLGNCYAKGTGVKRSVPRAVELYRQAAQQGEPDAMLSLGLLHEDGNGVKKSSEAALSLYRQSAAKGFGPAETALGQCYLWGYGVEQDMAEALRFFESAARRGDVLAHHELGNCYKDGHAVEKDIGKAVMYYKKAAAKGSAVSLVQYGDFLYHGNGVKKDYTKAFEQFKRAAKLGAAEGYRWLGDCYADAIGTERDMKKAVQMYRKGGELGSTSAWTCLGSCYERGDGIEKNKAKALSSYKKAADDGDYTAMNNLGILYEQGSLVRRDFKKAVAFYRNAVDYGSIEALCNLADCYSVGNGVEKNQEKAVELYRDASIHGMAGAKCELGFCYYSGKGVEKNYKKAVALFKEAAETEPEAVRQLGTACYDGHGVKQSYEKAVQCYRDAIAAGNENAYLNLAHCYSDGAGVPKDDAKAAELYKKSAATGNKVAMLCLGNRYFEGRGVKQDFAEAVKLFMQGEGAEVI